jgi:hypothetical protein
MYVLENTIPYIPETVWHDPDMNIPWTNPIRFLGNGTLPVDIFFAPDTVYRLEFRQNNGVNPPSQNDPLIYEVNDYIPGSDGSIPVDTVAFASSNQVTNPQFSLINFTSPYVFTGTNPDPINIAPGWYLELAGTGTVTITQVPLSSSNTNPSNAPYALRITINGWTTDSVVLRQRFEQNGMLWANKIVSSTITARLDGAPQRISATLVDSNSDVLASVLRPTVINEEWNEYTDYGELPETENPNTPPAAYVDYRLAIPSNIDIYVTSIQLVVQDLPFEPSFEQDSINRQIDHTFNYYKPWIEYKPIPSYTAGWDFSLNPAQFGETGDTLTPTSIGVNKSKYAWDQTILFQSADDSLEWSRNSASRGFVVTPLLDTSFAVIQYLPQAIARDILSQHNAIQLRGFVSVGTLSGTISLFWTDDVTLPDLKTPNFNSLVASITAGVPTAGGGGIHGNWNAVANESNPTSVPFQLTTSDVAVNAIGFNGIVAKNDATYLAVVVAFDTFTAGRDLTLEYISLVGGDIPTRPAPLTPDEARSQLYYYYESSLPAGQFQPQGFNGGLSFYQVGAVNSGGQDGFFATTFGVQYKEMKLMVPIFTVWSGSSGTQDNVTGINVFNGIVQTGGAGNVAITAWTVLYNQTTGKTFAPNSAAVLHPVVHDVGTTSAQGLINFHYTADARLGIVLS